jgi:D-galactarolactone cycloisomerase
MEVVDAEVVPLKRDLGERFANAQKWIDSREYCLLRLTADDGTVGWGECWGPVAGNRELLTDLASRVEGVDPAAVERVHDDLVFELRSAYHSFVPASVVSAVDTALWDLRGKHRNESLSAMLGGRRRESLRAYATGGFFPDVDRFEAVREQVVAEAEAHVDAGFGALKQKIGLERHFGWGAERDVELVRAVRNAVGADVRLLVDANHAYDRATAERVGRELADLDLVFFEEPIPPEHIRGYGRLADRLDVGVAGGECWAFESEFRRAIDAGVDYLQPDVTSAGGPTTMRRVTDAARTAGVQVHPHVFGSAVALAASVQVAAALPGAPMLEFDRTPNPIRDDLAAVPVKNDGPLVRVPDGPGIGVTVDEDVLADFRRD